jgi:hypothetical protein
MANKLGRVRNNKTHLDLVILRDSKKKRGEIRVKANRILWAQPNEKGWHGVSLRRFEEFITKEGKRQSK